MALMAADSPGLQPGTTASGNAMLDNMIGQAQAQAQGGGFAPSPVGGDLSPTVRKWYTWFDVRPMPGAIIPGVYGGRFDDNMNLGRAQRERAVRTQNEKRDGDRARLKEYADRIIEGNATPDELAELWQWAVGQVEAAEKLGTDPKDPFYWLDQRATEIESKRAEEQAKIGPKTVTQTQRTFNLTNPEDARALIRQAAQDYMGKRMSDEDMEKFVSALNAKEQANPTVTTTTSNYDENGTLVDSTSSTTGGPPSPTAEADTFLDEGFNTEADLYRAGTTYFDVAQALVGGIT